MRHEPFRECIGKSLMEYTEAKTDSHLSVLSGMFTILLKCGRCHDGWGTSGLDENLACYLMRQNSKALCYLCKFTILFIINNASIIK